ncbi:MAG: hypothetical protein EPN62_00915 [Candidimonas sp.]|nr:MAG: hypothetical protein EPN77_01915 [Candidimonas sp.]TAM26889.1 MAG: hypothetical protein EPN62_00915 [Candidimonas sp.]
MRGQNAIIKMRLEGYKPEFIFVDAFDLPCGTRRFTDPENCLLDHGHASIQIGPDDVVATLDLRIVTGTTVVLNGSDQDKVRSVFAQLRKFNPARIVAATPDFVYDTAWGKP